HESHAASAFYPSPFAEAAVLTMDGVGEWATSSYGVGRGKDLEILAELRYPHSLGMLYSAFTYYTGFKVNSGEYKVMGLAPYGEPRFVERIMSDVLQLNDDGSFGVALAIHHKVLGNERRRPSGNGDAMKGSYLGPAFTDDEIETFLHEIGAAYERLSPDAVITRTAEALAQERVVGWLQGR